MKTLIQCEECGKLIVEEDINLLKHLGKFLWIFNMPQLSYLCNSCVEWYQKHGEDETN